MNLLQATIRVVSSAAFALHVAIAQTFVVDDGGGAGVDFTSLATATANAPDGAVLLVRAGLYTGSPTISGKSLTILADPGAEVLAVPGLFPTTFLVTGLTSGQSVYIRGLWLRSPGITSRALLRCANNAGLVCIEDVVPSPANAGPTEFEATSCAALWLRDCGFGTRAMLTTSEAVLVGCQVPAPNNAFQQSGIQVNGGNTQLVDCLVRGVPASTAPSAGPAVSMNGGTLRLLGSTQLVGGNVFSTIVGLAIAGTGTVRSDPGVTLSGGGTVVAPTIALATTPMPHVTVADVLPVGTVQASLHGPNGSAGFVLASLTVPAFVVPGLVADPIWLDPLSLVILTSGVPGPGAPVVATISLPAVSTTLGFRFAWQGLTFDASAGLQISNPEYTVVD